MDEARVFTLKDPEVQAARQQFEQGQAWVNRHHLSVGKLLFEDLFEMFAEPCMTIVDAASEDDVSKQAMHVKYNKYFKQFFGEKSGTQRRKVYTLERRGERFQRVVAEQLAAGFLGAVANRAREYGCTAEGIPLDSLLAGINKNKILINGHPCGIHKNTTTHVPLRSKRLYARWNVRLSQISTTSVQILQTDVPGFPEEFFVVPSAILREKRFNLESQKSEIKLYARMIKPQLIYRNCRPKLDVREYKDAWHLLPPKDNAQQPAAS